MPGLSGLAKLNTAFNPLISSCFGCRAPSLPPITASRGHGRLLLPHFSSHCPFSFRQGGPGRGGGRLPRRYCYSTTSNSPSPSSTHAQSRPRPPPPPPLGRSLLLSLLRHRIRHHDRHLLFPDRRSSFRGARPLPSSFFPPRDGSGQQRLADGCWITDSSPAFAFSQRQAFQSSHRSSREAVSAATAKITRLLQRPTFLTTHSRRPP